MSEYKRAIVLGGGSEIALAIVRATVAADAHVLLLGRAGPHLSGAADALRGDGYRDVQTDLLDADDTPSHGRVLGDAFARLGGADLVVLAVGLLGERSGVPADVDGAVRVLSTNAVGAGSLLLHAAKELKDRGGGTLVVLSSVAGEVVRPANLVYGASKAALDALARGTGDALRGDGVRVLVVRPGFVRTRMTSGLRATPFAIDAAAVGRAVARGLERGKTVIWAPAALRWMLLVLKVMPRTVIRRLPL
jgi:decaprenylphospho-beta-D-erythro-pentofuranosid-2-ulose 2-reductase